MYTVTDPESVRLLTKVRMLLDDLILPVWAELPATVDRREVFEDGLRYGLSLAGWHLRLDLRLVDHVVVPRLSIRLSPRPTGLGTLAGWIRTPGNQGYVDVATTSVESGEQAAVVAVLDHLRLAAWSHRDLGPAATGFIHAA